MKKNILPFRTPFFVTFIILLCTLCGCMISFDPATHKMRSARYVIGNGKVSKRTFYPGDFIGFDAFKMDIRLWQDTVDFVTMSGEENVIAEYNAKIDNRGVLTMTGNEYTIIENNIPLTLDIHMKKVEYMKLWKLNLVGQTPIKSSTLHITELSQNATLDVQCDSLFLNLAMHDCVPPNLLLKGHAAYTWAGLRDGATLTALSFTGHCLDFARHPTSIYIVNPLNFDVMHFAPMPEEAYKLDVVH